MSLSPLAQHSRRYRVANACSSATALAHPSSLFELARFGGLNIEVPLQLPGPLCVGIAGASRRGQFAQKTGPIPHYLAVGFRHNQSDVHSLRLAGIREPAGFQVCAIEAHR